MDYSYPLLCACERNADRIALIRAGAGPAEAITFRDLERRVAGVAAGLESLGVAGRPVASLLENEVETFVLYLGLARVGAISVPLNTRLTEAEQRHILDDAGATLLVAADERADEARRVAERSPSVTGVVLVGKRNGAMPSLRELCATPPGPSPSSATGEEEEAPATILYTSGSTGFPKGVVRSHRANTWNVVNSALGAPRRPGDVELFTLPAFGIGFLHFAFAALLGGATVVLDRAFDARRAWALLEEHRVTRTFLAPTMIAAMLAVEGQEERDISALEVISTAYAFPERLRARALERFGDRFVYMYGLTEAQLTSVEGPGRFAAQPTSVGRTMGVSRVGVFDAAGHRRAPGEQGEIGFAGPSVMAAYHGLPEETAATLRDGWVMTGDLGYVDAAGDLHYVGRSKEMIKSGGFSVDPIEVENAILATGLAAETAVLGVADEYWGERVVAFVAPSPGTAATTETGAGIVAACRRSIAGYKVPKQVLFVDALPVNATGKVERGRLRERYARTGVPPPDEPVGPEP